MPADQAGRLAKHARLRHDQALQRATAALAEMSRNGDTITIALLAASAEVSRSWIYTQPGLRDQIEQAQQSSITPRSPAC